MTTPHETEEPGRSYTMWDFYGHLPTLLGNAEQVSWNRFYNYLTGNSLLVLAWVTLYHEYTDGRAMCVGICLCVIGIILSINMAILGSWGRGFVDLLMTIGHWMETTQEKKTPGLSEHLQKAHIFRNLINYREEGRALHEDVDPTVFRKRLEAKASGQDPGSVALPLPRKRRFNLGTSRLVVTVIPVLFAFLFLACAIVAVMKYSGM